MIVLVMQDSIQSNLAQMRKGTLELCVLQVIGAKESYANEIIDKLESVGITISEGTLYPLLKRLLKIKAVAHKWQESSVGPPRKYYEMTRQGRQYLAFIESNWEEMNQAVQLLSKNLKRSTKTNKTIDFN